MHWLNIFWKTYKTEDKPFMFLPNALFLSSMNLLLGSLLWFNPPVSINLSKSI